MGQVYSSRVLGNFTFDIEESPYDVEHYSNLSSSSRFLLLPVKAFIFAMIYFINFYIWMISNAISFKEIATIPAVRPFSQRGIIFPMENWDNCTLNDGRQFGKCLPLDECPEVLRKWDMEHIYPKTCYFIKRKQIVCCNWNITESRNEEKSNLTASNNDEQKKKLWTTEEPEMRRRSDLGCELSQVFRGVIVSGLPTEAGEFPYMAALGWPSNIGDSIRYRCGGVLISHTYVLTAAHCAELGGAQPTVVRIGGTNLTDSTVGDIKIKRFITHPAYNVTSIYYDIALVELEEQYLESPACLWAQNHMLNNNVTALGYGHKSFGGQPSDQLLKAPLFVISIEECAKYYQNDRDVAPTGLDDTHLCAGDPQHLRDTCQGDSGGPLIIRGDEDRRNYVIGITSFGLGCAGEPPSIYTRVFSYIDWIEEIVFPADNPIFEGLNF
uniref:Peptidase S1 domain-containing protein n=1 Tax=Glossina palpalis gambiensis TaxID=67801 RepID=A0A1B0B007_9MUSC